MKIKCKYVPIFITLMLVLLTSCVTFAATPPSLSSSPPATSESTTVSLEADDFVDQRSFSNIDYSFFYKLIPSPVLRYLLSIGSLIICVAILLHVLRMKEIREDRDL